MHARITSDPIDAAALLAQAGPADGAAVLFVGIVREENDGRPVSGMTYETYAALAAKELERILRDVTARTGVTHLAAEHRTGDLAIGETSVAIVAASPHRAEAFEAARAVIEEIKQRLPVWKHEHYVDGADRWIEGVVPPGQRVP